MKGDVENGELFNLGQALTKSVKRIVRVGVDEWGVVAWYTDGDQLAPKTLHTGTESQCNQALDCLVAHLDSEGNLASTMLFPRR